MSERYPGNVDPLPQWHQARSQGAVSLLVEERFRIEPLKSFEGCQLLMVPHKSGELVVICHAVNALASTAVQQGLQLQKSLPTL